MWLSSFYEKHNFFFEVKYEEGPQHLFPQVLDKNQIIKKKNKKKHFMLLAVIE